jgi:hypothetical protein
VEADSSREGSAESKSEGDDRKRKRKVIHEEFERVNNMQENKRELTHRTVMIVIGNLSVSNAGK